MNAQPGVFGVALGLGGSLAGVVVFAGSLARRRPVHRLAYVVYPAAVAAGAVISFAAMERALITRDFSLAYVAQVGSTRTPALFNVAALWSALEGSILLWTLVLAGYLVAVVVQFRRRRADPLVGWAVVVMLVVAAFFNGLLAGPADPFRLVTGIIPTDGPGPNPLLQNHPLVAFHPPALYLGFVGFTVPFAFAIAGLITGRVGEGWLLATRRWTMFAWACLTAGIVLGAWWSYDVLGWGGYWAWDPVENASLLPWLTATAYLHSVVVQERRGMLRVWNLSLLCATFALTILGTFLTRSGVLRSVHAFSQSTLGPALIGFFVATVTLSVGLIVWRGDRLRSPRAIDSPLSREAAFLANNVVFAVLAFVVLLGTVYPLLVEAVKDRQISVGRPYFDRMAAPLGLALLTLMAIGPILPWRKASTPMLAHRLVWPLRATGITLVVAVIAGARGIVPLVALGLAGFAGGAALQQLAQNVRRHGLRALAGRTGGGMVVHLGVVVVAVALSSSSAYSRRAELTLRRDTPIVFAGHRLTFVGVDQQTTKAKSEQRALIEVDGSPMTPAIQRFANSSQPVGTPAIRHSMGGDLYLTVAALPDDASQPLRLTVLIMPLASWLWTGGTITLAGAVLATLPDRRRPVVPPPARRAQVEDGDAVAVASA